MFCFLPLHVRAQERVSCTASGLGFRCRIDAPNIKQRVTEYKTIRFLPGDRVRVSGGGCAQTGGSGRTWKHYVIPQGPNSDRLYHGLVQIPGAMPDLRRLVDVIGQTLVVPAGIDAPQFYLRTRDDRTRDDCVIDLNQEYTFVRQETWPGGEVKWYNGKVGRAGPLVNLGEKLRPLNGQVFIQYSGIWGSPGLKSFSSGYWGPAFNETAMGGDGFITA